VYKHKGSVYNFHFVKMADLQPGQVYYYRVRAGGSAWSTVHSFSTAVAEGPTTAAIFGDMGVYSYNNMGNLLEDSDAARISAIFHLGDHGYHLTGTRGDGYINAFSKVLARVPWVPVLGNHEFGPGDINRYINMTYGGGNAHDGSPCVANKATCTAHAHNRANPRHALLSMGSALGMGLHGGSTPSMTSRYYSVDVGLIHFVALDLNAWYKASDEAWKEPQLQWLKQDLAAASQNRDAVPWIIVSSHYPMYCTSNSLASPKLHNDGPEDDDDEVNQHCWSYGGSIQEVRDDLEPLFAEHGVDFYFAGHEHNYESSWPVLNSTSVRKSFDEPEGPVHFVTGAGGAPSLDTFDDSADFVRKRLSAWGYGRITAHNATHFTYDHVLNSNGSIYDSVTVVKSHHGPYKMLQRAASMFDYAV